MSLELFKLCSNGTLYEPSYSVVVTGVVVYRDDVRDGFLGVVPTVVCCVATDTLASALKKQ